MTQPIEVRCRDTDRDHLHLARRYWVRGDMPRWRDTAERLPVIANEVSGLIDSIILLADDDYY